MPRLSFDIASVSQKEYESLMQSYQGISLVPVFPPSFGDRTRQIFSRVLSTLGLSEPPAIPVSVLPLDLAHRQPHPILDPKFLEFCIMVAGYMHRGYIVGQGDGVSEVSPYRTVTLRGKVSGEIEFFYGQTRMVIRTKPHVYHAEIPDVPVYAQLRTLRQFTKDPSIAALLNRLVLWLSYFVYSTYYYYKIVACDPKTKEQHVLNTSFFLDLGSRMFL